MKKPFYLVVFIITLFFLSALPVNALELRYEEGIFNEREYIEVTFITGEPVLLKGTVQRRRQGGRGNANNLTNNLDYRLESEDGYIRLDRRVSFATETEKKMDEKQTIYDTKLNRLSEIITIGKDRYTLTDFQYTRSVIVDSQPAVDYFSGSWTSIKTYTLSNSKTEILIETQGDTVGYDHAWGSTETQKINGSILFDGEVQIEEEKKSQNWSGTFQVNLSFNRTRDLTYYANEPTAISFEGGYIETLQEEGILRYEANLPVFNQDGLVLNNWGLKTESGAARLASMPTQRRLPIPPFRDLAGHWAERPVLELASLEAFDVKRNYFAPSLGMTRGEFAYSLAKIFDLTTLSEKNKQQPANPFENRRQETSKETSPFVDVNINHPYYKEIKNINEAGIMIGVMPGRFAPDNTLTRAEAITALIKALGFEKLAPLQKPITPFRDDDKIPYWARDAIYVAAEMGIVNGNEANNVMPNDDMSRGEAAAFLQRMIHYLQRDLKTEYRERLINFW